MSTLELGTGHVAMTPATPDAAATIHVTLDNGVTLFGTITGTVVYADTVATPPGDWLEHDSGAPVRCVHCDAPMCRGYDTAGGPWAHLYRGPLEGSARCVLEGTGVSD